MDNPSAWFRQWPGAEQAMIQNDIYECKYIFVIPQSTLAFKGLKYVVPVSIS